MAPGGHPGQHALDDEGVEQVGRAERLPGVEPRILAPALLRPRGRSVLTWRQPSTTDPFVLPCQFPTRSWAPILACFSPIASVSSGSHHLAHDDEPGGHERANRPSLSVRLLGQGDGGLERQASKAIRLVHLREHSRRVASSSLVVPFLVVGLVSDTYLTAGLRRGTTTSLRATRGRTSRVDSQNGGSTDDVDCVAQASAQCLSPPRHALAGNGGV